MSLRALVERRILIVEDEYLAAKCMADALQAAGARVVGPAASVAHAVCPMRLGAGTVVALTGAGGVWAGDVCGVCGRMAHVPCPLVGPRTDTRRQR